MGTRSGQAPLTDYVRDLRDQYASGHITRQEFLRWGAMLGVSLPTLSAWATAAQPTFAAEAAMAPSASPRPGGTLRFTAPQPTTVEPAGLTDVQGAATVQQVCEQLVRVGADLIPRPHLAESWTASADAKTWTFKIRLGVAFNNGAPFTADDVVWTFQYLLNPKTASTARSTLTYLTDSDVEKVDAYTVRFHLQRS